MINLDQLRIFQAVAQARSFTRAADAVHLTQPGVSKHIKQMEEDSVRPFLTGWGKKLPSLKPAKFFLQPPRKSWLPSRRQNKESRN